MNSIREYIINNFKNDSKEDIAKAIEDSIKNNEEETLPGMGALFEIAWTNSSKDIQTIIINNLKQGLTNK